MLQETLTISEIVEETIKHYNSNPRSVIDEKCCYFTKEGRNITAMCAVGRVLDQEDERVKSIIYSNAFNETAVDELAAYADGLDNILKPEYKGHPLSFWEMLQGLHDTDSYWSGGRITGKGRGYADQIIDIYEPVPTKDDRRDNDY